MNHKFIYILTVLLSPPLYAAQPTCTFKPLASYLGYQVELTIDGNKSSCRYLKNIDLGGGRGQWQYDCGDHGLFTWNHRGMSSDGLPHSIKYGSCPVPMACDSLNLRVCPIF